MWILDHRRLTDEYPVEWAFRMARLSILPAGTNEIMRFVVQREVYREKEEVAIKKRSWMLREHMYNNINYAVLFVFEKL